MILIQPQFALLWLLRLPRRLPRRPTRVRREECEANMDAGAFVVNMIRTQAPSPAPTVSIIGCKNNRM